MKEDEETDVIILLLSMIYRYLNSLLLKFSIRYFSYINGCHTVGSTVLVVNTVLL